MIVCRLGRLSQFQERNKAFNKGSSSHRDGTWTEMFFNCIVFGVDIVSSYHIHPMATHGKANPRPRNETNL